MRRRIALIQDALRKRKREVPASGAWLALHEEWGVGRQQGKRIHLSLEDRDAMRQRAMDVYGVDPVTLDMEQDRTDMARTTADEKLSRQQAFGRLVRVAVPGGGVTVQPSEGSAEKAVIPTPPGVLLSVEPAQLCLDQAQVQRVLVIENANIMERWWEMVPYLPARWRQHTLLAYRGHRQDLRSMQEWIGQHRGTLEVGFYGDFDPHGVRIGLRSYAPLAPPGQFWLIGPKVPHAIPRHANKPDIFEKHASALRYLRRHVPPARECCSMIEQIHLGQWAVTQEAMLAHGIGLAEYAL